MVEVIVITNLIKEHFTLHPNFEFEISLQEAEDSPPASPNRCVDTSEVFQGFTYVEPSMLTAAMSKLSTKD